MATTYLSRSGARLFLVQGLVRPLVKFATGFFMSTGPSLEALKAANGVESLVLQSGALVNRTITAQTFSGLVNTAPVQSLVAHHFSATEIAAIERSLRRS